MDERIPHGAELVLSKAAIDAAFDQMASAIDAHYAGEEIVLLTVMIGGMIPSTELALRLKTPIVIDYVHATRYQGEQGQPELQWLGRPRTSLHDQHVLIVDDILDEGPTLRAIIDWCHGQAAKSVASAVLTDKQHDRRMNGVRADFVGLTVPDRYLFGYGMDYRGTLRHLPAIYALAEQLPADASADDDELSNPPNA